MDILDNNATDAQDVSEGNTTSEIAKTTKPPGRPLRSAQKNKLTIVSTGKGRGTPRILDLNYNDFRSNDEDILDKSATNAQDASEDDTPSKIAKTTKKTETGRRGPGRPPKKRSRKNLLIIVSTGKGRGRPRNKNLRSKEVQKKEPHKKKSKRGRGRPKKKPNSDDVNKQAAKLNGSEGITNSEGVLTPVKRRVGRPFLGKIPRWTGPTGRPRGRPKVNIAEKNSVSNGAVNNEVEADNNDVDADNFTDFILQIENESCSSK